MHEIMQHSHGEGAKQCLAKRKLDALGNIRGESGFANDTVRMGKLKAQLQLADSLAAINRAASNESDGEDEDNHDDMPQGAGAKPVDSSEDEGTSPQVLPKMIDFPFERTELADAYIPLERAEVDGLSRTVDDVKNCRGVGAEGLSVVSCIFLPANGNEPAMYEWFHAEITTKATKKHFGLKYDGERKVYNDALPMCEYGIRWYLVRE